MERVEREHAWHPSAFRNTSLQRNQTRTVDIVQHVRPSVWLIRRRMSGSRCGIRIKRNEKLGTSKTEPGIDRTQRGRTDNQQIIAVP